MNNFCELTIIIWLYVNVIILISSLKNLLIGFYLNSTFAKFIVLALIDKIVTFLEYYICNTFSLCKLYSRFI